MKPDDWTWEDLLEAHQAVADGVLLPPEEGFIPMPSDDELKELIAELKADLRREQGDADTA